MKPAARDLYVRLQRHAFACPVCRAQQRCAEALQMALDVRRIGRR